MQICQVRLETFPCRMTLTFRLGYVADSLRFKCHSSVMNVCELRSSVRRYFRQNHHLIHIFLIAVLVIFFSLFLQNN